MDQSDTDSLSLNSTLTSEKAEYYNVERILAEGIDENGEPTYLVDWEGYAMTRSSWEPRESFLQDDTLRAWEDTKRRIQEGLEEAYDLTKLQLEKDRLASEKDDRKERRQEKRERLGARKSRRTRQWIIEQPLISDDESDVRLVPTRRASGNARKVSRTSSKRDEEFSNFSAPRTHAMKARTTSTPDLPMVDPMDRNLQRNATYQGTITKRDSMSRYKQLQNDQQRSLISKDKFRTAPKTKASKGIHLNPSKAAKSTGGLHLKGVDIFRSWNAAPKRKKPQGHSNIQKGDAPSKQFSKLSTRRRVQQAGKNEPEPQYSALKFVNLDNGKVIEKARTDRITETSKTPYQMIQDERKKKQSEGLSESMETPYERSPSPMDVDARINEPSLFVEEIQKPEPHKTDTSSDRESQCNEKTNQDVVSPGNSDAFDNSTAVFPKPTTSMHILGNEVFSQIPETRPGPIRGATTDTHIYSQIPETEDQQRYCENSEINMSDKVQNSKSLAQSTEHFEPAAHTKGLTRLLDYTAGVPPRLPEYIQRQLVSYPLPKIKGDEGVGKPRHKTYKEDVSDLYGDIIVEGVRQEDQRATFRGLRWEVQRLFLTIKEEKEKATPRAPVKIHEFCDFKDYTDRYHRTGTAYFGAGHILPGPRGISVSKLSQQLQSLQKGGIFFAKFFTLVIYPRGIRGWESVDSLYPPHSPHCPLRFLIRECEFTRYQEIHFATKPEEDSLKASVPPYAEETFPSHDNAQFKMTFQTEPTRDPRLQQSKSLTGVDAPEKEATSVPSFITRSEEETKSEEKPKGVLPIQTMPRPNIDFDEVIRVMMNTDQKKILELFKARFDIDWENMVPRSDNSQDSQKEVSVFVHYPQRLEQERKMLATFLQRIGAKRYDSSQSGDWRAFSENMVAGVLLLHASERDFRTLPRLGHMLFSRAGINVFRINLGSPYVVEQQEICPKPGCMRIFSSGSGVLLMDSVFLRYPQNIARILAWFREFILTTKPPNTWQLFTRPKLPAWIWHFCDDLKSAPLEQCLPYLDIFTEFRKLVSQEDLEFDGNTPKPRAPYRSPDVIPGYNLNTGLEEIKANGQVLASNEEKLIDWFGETTLGQVETHRRFVVLYDGPDQKAVQAWKNKWTHLRIFSSDEYIGRQVALWEKHKKRRETKTTPLTSPEDASGTENKEARYSKK